MLKRTLVAASLLAAFNASADFSVVLGHTDADSTNSATQDVANVYSYEGSVNDLSIAVPTLEVTLGAEYQVNDTITLTFDAPLASSLTIGGVSIANDTSVPFSGTLTVESVTGSSVVLKVASLDGTSTNDNKFHVSGILLDTAAVRALSLEPLSTTDRVVDVTASSSRAGTALESTVSSGVDAARTLDPVVVRNELVFAAAEDSTNIGIIGSVGDELSTSFTTTLDVTRRAGITNSPVTLVSTEFTLNGDFAFIDDDTPATAGTQNASVTADSGAVTDNSGVISATAIVLPGNLGGSGTANTSGESINLATGSVLSNNAAIPGQKFSATASIVYKPARGANETLVLSDSSAGDLSFNGKVAVVQAMPFGSNIDPFLWVSNDTSTDAFASFTIKHGGTVYGPFDAGKIAKNANTRIASALLDAAAASGITSGRGDITITLGTADAGTEGTAVVGLVEGQSTTGGTAQTDIADANLKVAVHNFSVYAGYKVISADDRLELPVVLK